MLSYSTQNELIDQSRAKKRLTQLAKEALREGASFSFLINLSPSHFYFQLSTKTHIVRFKFMLKLDLNKKEKWKVSHA